MAISDTNATENEKQKEMPKGKEKKEKPLTKVVIRRLPPSMDQESFLMQVSPVPDYDYIYMVKGDMSLGENAFSRVYINFTNADDIFMFKEKFDNYVFVDHKGHEYPAVVEFASFQKIPRKRKPRPDPKSATIETDPIYLEFLESLKEQPTQDEKPEFSYQFSSDNKDEIASTPLLDFVKQRRIDKQRIREERREERRRKELERKRVREDERKKHDQKSSNKTIIKPNVSSRSNKATLDSVKEVNEKSDTKAKSDDEKEDSLSEKNPSPHSIHKDERKSYPKPKQRYSSRTERSDYAEKKVDYKNRRDDYRDKEYRNRRFDDYKKETDTKPIPRKAKKYSEKREERKNEARKAEQRKIEGSLENSNTKDDGVSTDVKSNVESEKTNKQENDNEKSKNEIQSLENKQDTEGQSEHVIANNEHTRGDKDTKYHNKEHDPRAQRRIRNKDRPTMAIYQPGMLSKRKTVEGEGENNSD